MIDFENVQTVTVCRLKFCGFDLSIKLIGSIFVTPKKTSDKITQQNVVRC